MPRQREYPRVLSLVLVMFLLLLLERDIVPPVFGVSPSFLLPFVLAVGMTEGPCFGGGFGAAAGLFLDQGVTSAYGFRALLLMTVGIAAGLFISYFRMTVPTAAVFTLAAAVFVFVLRWFFLYYLWHGTGWFFSIVPLQILYAVLLSAPVFLLVRAVSRRFGSLKKAEN